MAGRRRHETPDWKTLTAAGEDDGKKCDRQDPRNDRNDAGRRNGRYTRLRSVGGVVFIARIPSTPKERLAVDLRLLGRSALCAGC